MQLFQSPSVFSVPVLTLEDIKWVELLPIPPSPHPFVSISISPIIYSIFHLLFFRTTAHSLVAITVAETRCRNESAHPAAPVMTKATKVKAGINPAKPCKKRMTKEARICELKEEVVWLKHLDDAHPSKEPLVSVLLV